MKGGTYLLDGGDSVVREVDVEVRRLVVGDGEGVRVQGGE